MRAFVLALLLAAQGAVRPPVFDVLGVCAIDERQIACWSTDGQSAPELAETVRRGTNASTEALAFVPRSKNRYVIVRHGEYSSLTYGGDTPGLRGFNLTPPGREALSAYRVVSAPSALTASFTLRVGVIEGSAAEMPLREGAKAKLEAMSVEVGKIREEPTWPLGGYQGLAGIPPLFWGRWGFPVERRGERRADGLRIEAIGHDGKPIVFVDVLGRPVDAKLGEAYYGALRELETTSPVRPTIFPASVNTSLGQSDESSALLWFGTSIEPRWIARLRVRRVAVRSETIGPFALDPRHASGP